MLPFHFRTFFTVTALVVFMTVGCDTSTKMEAPISFDLMDNERTIIFTDRSGTVMALDRESGNLTKLLDTAERFGEVAVSPHQNFIAVTTPLESREHPVIVLFKRDAHGTFTEQTRFSGHQATFSGNDEIYYSKGGDSGNITISGGVFWKDFSLWKFSIEKGNSRQLSPQTFFQISGICVDKTRQHVYFSAKTSLGTKVNGNASSNIYRFDEGTNKIEQFTQSPLGYSSGSKPSISTEGDKLAFVSDRERKFQYDILIQELDSDEVVNLQTAESVFFPNQLKFGVSSNRIYFLGTSDGSSGVNQRLELWQWSAPDQLERVVTHDVLRGK